MREQKAKRAATKALSSPSKARWGAWGGMAAPSARPARRYGGTLPAKRPTYGYCRPVLGERTANRGSCYIGLESNILRHAAKDSVINPDARVLQSALQSNLCFDHHYLSVPLAPAALFAF